jgi:carbon storage regulator CsrA
MLVLTRKLNEEILIGDDIKITLVRIKGNTVRVGIEAPRDVRVKRGELADRQEDSEEQLAYELAERETVFAHPQPAVGRHPQRSVRSAALAPSPEPKTSPQPRMASQQDSSPLQGAITVEGAVKVEGAVQVDGTVEQPGALLIVGRVRPVASETRMRRAPLAGFVSAT